MSFLSDIQAFEKRALEAASTNTNKVFADLTNKSVELSPTPSGKGGYSIGTIKDNWYPSVGAPSSEYSGSTSATGSASISRINSILSTKPFYGKDNVLYFTNNTDWAYRAEFLGWPGGQGANGWVWSGRIGPYAMVSLSITYLQNKYQ